MTISSRTPDGEPNRCPICGNDLRLAPSNPAGDAPCPHCGHLLWWLNERFAQQLRAKGLTITPETSIVDDLRAESLDVVELVMELEEEFGIVVPESDYERIRTVGDAIAYIEQFSKGVP